MNWRISTRRIDSNNATKIYKGDAVVNIVPATGYITQASVGAFATAPCAGIFWGCQYLSVSQKRVIWNQYWPGGDAQGDVIAYVIDDPNARFVVQTQNAGFQISGTIYDFGTSPIGQYAMLNVGVGDQNTQQSGMFLDTINATSTNPFIITNMVLDPPGSNGTDATSLNNWVEVGFNNEWLRTNSAVPGIA
jgi:hypothetical protein